jgi:hypothetical protein
MLPPRLGALIAAGALAASALIASTTLQLSTKGLISNAASDATYTEIEADIADITARRDTLALTIQNALDDAQFNATAIPSKTAAQWIKQANALLQEAVDLNASF